MTLDQQIKDVIEAATRQLSAQIAERLQGLAGEVSQAATAERVSAVRELRMAAEAEIAKRSQEAVAATQAEHTRRLEEAVAAARQEGARRIDEAVAGARADHARKLEEAVAAVRAELTRERETALMSARSEVARKIEDAAGAPPAQRPRAPGPRPTSEWPRAGRSRAARPCAPPKRRLSRPVPRSGMPNSPRWSDWRRRCAGSTPRARSQMCWTCWSRRPGGKRRAWPCSSSAALASSAGAPPGCQPRSSRSESRFRWRRPACSRALPARQRRLRRAKRVLAGPTRRRLEPCRATPRAWRCRSASAGKPWPCSTRTTRSPAGDEVPSAWPEVVELLARHAARCLEVLTVTRVAQPVVPVTEPPPTPRYAPQARAHAATSDDEEDAARRYAKLLVSEIKLYHEAAVTQGRRDRNLLDRLRQEIDRARRLYDERVPVAVRSKTDYFGQELVRTLANGDRTLLGSA